MALIQQVEHDGSRVHGNDAPRRSRPSPLGPVALADGGLLLGLLAVILKVEDGAHTAADTALSAASGFVFLAAGLAAHLRRPANRTGLLLMAVGVAFFAEDLQLSRHALVFTVGLVLASASAPVLTHLVLAFPHGRLPSRPARILTAAAYALTFGTALAGALVKDWTTEPTPRPENLLLVWPDPALALDVRRVGQALGALVVAAAVVLLARRVALGDRRERLPFAPAIALAAVAGAASVTAGVAGSDAGIYLWAGSVYRLCFLLGPVALLVGVFLAEPGPGAVADLVLAARRTTDAGDLERLLADALGDPSVRLEQDPARPAGDGAVRLLAGVDGRPLGVLSHGEAAWGDQRVTEAVAALAALVLDNRRLAAEAREHLAEVRASRERLVAVADEERQRLERDLHDGAQQRLVSAALGLRLLQQRLADDPDLRDVVRTSAESVEAAIVELRELARGIRPPLLTEAGVIPAVWDLVDRTPLPVELTAPTMGRLSPVVEATVFFVVAEALTNVLKHAGADRVEVGLHPVGGAVHVEVADNGCGGAVVVPDSGLGRLRDRVRALGGDLTVGSVPGGGTCVLADVPDGDVPVGVP